MKITSKILHLPPYISTTWNHVRALYLQDTNLIVSLIDSVIITIPNLKPEICEAIFSAHSAFLEGQIQGHTHRIIPTQEQATPLYFFQTSANQKGEAELGTAALKFNMDALGSMQSAMQHNPAQANMPELPKELLNKIAAIAKVVAPEDIQNMPKPEPHCNCMHCQMARAIQNDQAIPETPISTQPKEEEVSDEELTFQQWDIVQTGEQLYSLTNRLDTQEKYSVYLGDPVGCTCGKASCEHIIAVLRQ